MKTLLFIVSIFTFQYSFCQWNYFASNAENVAGTYTDLGNLGTAITTNYSGGAMSFSDDVSSIQDIGFDFTFAGQLFNQFVLSSNGFIKLGTIAPASNVHDILSSTETNVISPFNYYLLPTLGGLPEYRVYTSGNAPDRVCTIQFKQLRDYRISLPVASQFAELNFQIKLYETSNDIEFVYGTFIRSGAAPGGFSIVVCAMGGNNLDIITATKIPAMSWDLAGFTNTTIYFMVNNGSSILPAPGRTFRFVQGTVPVKLTNFLVTKRDRKNLLYWRTEQEINTKEFFIERSNFSENFKTIGNVIAIGNTSLPTVYYFTDETPLQGTNYYRLKIIDFDGRFEYSPIRSVNNAEVDISIYPVPVAEVVNIFVFAKTKGIAEVIITDITGKSIYKNRLDIIPGSNILEINMQHFIPGVYIATIKYADKVVVKKISRI